MWGGYVEARRSMSDTQKGRRGQAGDDQEGEDFHSFPELLKDAQKGKPISQFNVGMCYYFGEGVKEDKKAAVEWLTKAASKNLAVAQFNLGLCYQEGEGVEYDDSKAVRLLHKAAAQAYPPAMYNLSIR